MPNRRIELIMATPKKLGRGMATKEFAKMLQNETTINGLTRDQFVEVFCNATEEEKAEMLFDALLQRAPIHHEHRTQRTKF